MNDNLPGNGEVLMKFCTIISSCTDDDHDDDFLIKRLTMTIVSSINLVKSSI